MRAKTYEIIEHTADIGIRVQGASLEELFQNTGLAMFEIIAEQKFAQNLNSKIKKLEVNQTAQNIEELLIQWLNELLALSADKGLIFSEFIINKIDKNFFKAAVWGQDISLYRLKTEIKAATYHALKVEKSDQGWKAEVIFDV